jgi:hypothetical protein
MYGPDRHVVGELLHEAALHPSMRSIGRATDGELSAIYSYLVSLN